jgi:hypothetical protein
MKANSLHRSLLRFAALLGTALLVGGCLQERLAWSPDGRHAAIVTAGGLYLSDANGKLSALLAPKAYRVAWLPDSQRLVLARKKPARNFAEISAALGPDRTRALILKAEILAKKIKELPSPEDLKKGIEADLGDDLAGLVAYLREQPQHLATLREKLGKEWKKDDETQPVDLNEVVVARLTGDTLEFGPTLFIGLPEIKSLRPAPGGGVVALAMQPELSPIPDNGIGVLVAPLDGSAPATRVATQGTTDPDWSRDGRSLVFFKGTGESGTSDDLRLGALVQRQILDATGRIRPAQESTDLAGLIFHKQNRVRCLRDGRVLFNASPFTLPTTGSSHNDREQLFMLDRTKEAALRPLIPAAQLAQLPKALSAFEVSPDESQVLICSDDAEVWLLTIATGTVEHVAAKLESKKGSGEGSNYPAATWRMAGEVTFLRQTPHAADPTGPRTLELVLRRGTTDTVLSANWDPAILRRLID